MEESAVAADILLMRYGLIVFFLVQIAIAVALTYVAFYIGIGLWGLGR